MQDVEAILAEAEPGTVQGLRDRALLETLYATGLRRLELAGAAIYDADLTRGLLWVRHGKGGRECVVPLGARACAWLDKYLTESRPQLLAADITALFLTGYGEPVGASTSCPARSSATWRSPVHARRRCRHPLHPGHARARRHADIGTTQIYTHVSIDKLLAVHHATHPSRLQRHRDTQTPVSDPSLDESREALLGAIEREGEEVHDEGSAGVAGDPPK